MRINYAHAPSPSEIGAPKRETHHARQSSKGSDNLSLRADLVERARALELNVSDLVESALEKVILEAEQARWQSENEAAMDYYNSFMEKHGLFSDAYRKF
jgi:antitoxin CcdA